jgi:hypothetical protein
VLDEDAEAKARVPDGEACTSSSTGGYPTRRWPAGVTLGGIAADSVERIERSMLGSKIRVPEHMTFDNEQPARCQCIEIKQKISLSSNGVLTLILDPNPRTKIILDRCRVAQAGLAQRHAEEVRPQDQREQRYPPCELGKADGEQPSEEPQHPRERERELDRGPAALVELGPRAWANPPQRTAPSPVRSA